MPPTDASQRAAATVPIRRGWFIAAVVALALAAAAATLNYVYNYDIFWHLAGGEWMLRHVEVLDTDPFTVDPEPRWVNVHWLFQVIVTLLHSAGGFGLLSAVKAAMAAGVMVLFAFALRRVVPVAWLIVCGLAAVVIIETRMRVRPEAFTMVFLMLTIALMEGVRRGAAARRLWLLVPVMLVWVNMHGLYILGPAVFWSAMLGAAIDRRLGRSTCGNLPTATALAACLCATIACLLTPWPIEAAAQPLLLWTRISGQTAYYTYGVSEFLPTWPVLHLYVVAVATTALSLVACGLNFRAAPIGHFLWALAFATLAILARRNVALTGPVCGYLLALHGAAVLRNLARRRRRASAGDDEASSLASACPRLAVGLNLLSLLLAAAVIGAYATEWVFQVKRVPRRFGAGLQRELYPLDIARRLGRLDCPGEVFCDNWGDSGTFIYHSRRRVWMDGRLEAHSLERFESHYRIRQALRTVQSAGSIDTELDDRLRFFYVRSTEREQLTAMSQSRRFRLLFIEPIGACFARTGWQEPSPAGRPSQPLPDEANLDEYDVPLGRSLRIAAVSVPPRRWYRRNAQSLSYPLGSMLLWLGWASPNRPPASRDPQRLQCTLLALRYLTACQAEGIMPPDIARGMLAQAHQQRSLQLKVTPSPVLPVDVHSARALHLYGRMDLTDLADVNARMFAVQHVDALVRASQFGAAERAAADLLKNLPPPQRIDPPRRYLDLRAWIAKRLADSRTRAETQKLPLPQRIELLTSPEVGLIEQAIAELRAAPAAPDSRLTLGDLLLRRGRTQDARRAYRQLQPAEADRWKVGLRLALCDWVDGRLYEAADALDELGRTTGRPAVRYYHAVLLEQLGRYERARQVLRGERPLDQQLDKLIRRIRERLAAR